MINKKIVERITYPVRLQLKSIAGYLPASFRYGKVFNDTLKFLENSQWWDKDQLEEYQFQELRKLLNHSYSHVPYYKKLFSELNLNPLLIRDIDDFKQIPVLDKDTFKLNFSSFTSNNINPHISNISKINTSGSTGKPLEFYVDKEIQQKEMAFIFHQWSRVNYKIDDRRAMIRGSLKNGEKYNYDPYFKVLNISQDINQKNVLEYVKLLKKYKIKFIHGYPSVIGYFAHIISRNKIKIPFKIESVLFASENVYDWQRELVEDIFKCRAFSHYGLAEKTCLAGECENSTDYHFIPQYGITEIDKKTGEIIATGFLNHINPFIRYKTGDIVEKIVNKSKCCKRDYFPIVSGIEGRKGDYIVTNKGLISPTGMLSIPLKKTHYIKKTQIIQKSETLIKVKVVPWEKTTKYYQELDELENNFKKILGSEIKIVFEETDNIESDKSGKFKWIKSEISNDIINEGF